MQKVFAQKGLSMENMDLNIEIVGKNKAFAIALSAEARKFFQNRVSDFFFSLPSNGEKGKISITFKAYDFFWIKLRYKNKKITCGIEMGDKLLYLCKSEISNSEDLHGIFKLLEMQLELRIPDKFLKSNHWLRGEKASYDNFENYHEGKCDFSLNDYISLYPAFNSNSRPDHTE